MQRGFDVSGTSAAFSQEIVGPVALVVPVAGVQQAIRLTGGPS